MSKLFWSVTIAGLIVAFPLAFVFAIVAYVLYVVFNWGGL